MNATQAQLVAIVDMCMVRGLNPGDYHRTLDPLTSEQASAIIARISKIPLPPHFSSQPQYDQ